MDMGLKSSCEHSQEAIITIPLHSVSERLHLPSDMLEDLFLKLCITSSAAYRCPCDIAQAIAIYIGIRIFWANLNQAH